MNIDESLQYQEVQPYLHAAGIAAYSAQQQLRLLREKLSYQASTGQLLRADVIRISRGILSADEQLKKADAAVTALIQIVQEEIM
jgi:hypothetical protein